MKLYYVIFILTFCAVAQADQDTVDLLLKARGLQALERMDKLSTKAKATKDKKLSKLEQCEWSFESAYAAFALPETMKIVKKSAYVSKTSEATAYIIYIKAENEEAFQMNYVFLGKAATEPMSNEILRLPSDWRVKTSNLIPNKIVVNSPNCYFEFSTKSPIESKFDIMNLKCGVL